MKKIHKPESLSSIRSLINLRHTYDISGLHHHMIPNDFVIISLLFKLFIQFTYNDRAVKMNLEGFNSETKVWSGPKHDVIYNSNISLGSLILNVLKKTPEVVAQVSADDGVELTCHELRLRTMKIASHLISSGYKQGDVVGMITTNTENLSPLVFSCLTLGLPINTLAPVMVESDIVHMYSRTKPKIIFCDANIIKTVEAATKKLPQSADIFTLDSKVEGIKFVGDIIAIDFDEENFM